MNNWYGVKFAKCEICGSKARSRSIKISEFTETPITLTSFVFLCLMFLMLSRLFIAALWSPAGKGLSMSQRFDSSLCNLRGNCYEKQVVITTHNRLPQPIPWNQTSDVH